MKKISYEIYAGKAAELMPKSAFLTTSFGGKDNTMTIGWGTAGIVWRKPIFLVLVRESRFTKGLIDQSGEFTVTFPYGDAKEALAFCGVKSGRDMDKIAESGLTVRSGDVVKTPVLNIAGLHLECKTVYRHEMAPANLCPNIQKDAYSNNDYHTLYFGEIVSAYEL